MYEMSSVIIQALVKVVPNLVEVDYVTVCRRGWAC